MTDSSNLEDHGLSEFNKDRHLRALGAAIRRRRSDLGLSQEKLAERAGLHRNYVGGVERGERNPSFANLLRITLALEVTVEELMKRYSAELEFIDEFGE
jgi:transcriptional regulator with XRE-family HTH domain